MSGPGYGAPPRSGRPARSWILLIVAVAIAAVLATLAILLLTGTISVGGGHPEYGYFGGFFLLILLLWIAFFVVRVAFWTTRAGRRSYYGGPPGPHRDPAVMMARQRYARGEITREQYDQIMTDLERRGRGPGGPLSGG